MTATEPTIILGYYEMLRALHHHADNMRTGGYDRGPNTFRRLIPDMLDALGYEIPGPVIGENGKPIKVWTMQARYALDSALVDEILAKRQTPGHQRISDFRAAVAAPTKKATIETLYGGTVWADRIKTSQVTEVTPESLLYKAVVANPGCLVIPTGDGTGRVDVVVPLTDLRKGA